MSILKILDLNPVNSEIVYDSGSDLKDLTNKELGISGGAVKVTISVTIEF